MLVGPVPSSAPPTTVVQMSTAASPLGRMDDGHRFHAPRVVDEHDRDRDRHLDRLVAAGLSDVRVHLERVNRRIDADDPEGLYGALVDLFIATDERSEEVRRRAMFWAGDRLARHHRTALDAHVATGLHRATPMPPSRRSIRSLGVVGSVRLVGRPDGGAMATERAVRSDPVAAGEPR